jgi:hypothetical protein
MGVLSSLTVPAVCTGPPCSKWSNLWRRPNTWHPPEISLFSAKPEQCVLLQNRKNISNHYCCPISAVILTTSKLEAVLEICRCSLKLSNWGKGRGGGLSQAPLHLSSEQVQQVASGYACLVTPFHCYASVSFSFSTFLCFSARCGGLIKNI